MDVRGLSKWANGAERENKGVRECGKQTLE